MRRATPVRVGAIDLLRTIHRQPRPASRWESEGKWTALDGSAGSGVGGVGGSVTELCVTGIQPRELEWKSQSRESLKGTATVFL